MIRKYLVTYFKNIKFKKKTHIIFENEYLKKLYKDHQLRDYRCSFIENLNQVYKKKTITRFVKKKLKDI